MTNTKWLRRALLGSVALGVMASGAHADELAELKAQLEGLQSRVNQLEQQPAMGALPEGASFLTLSRGSAELPNYGTQAARDAHNVPSDRGFTIAVTPTADLPAPIAEVVVYGYVKGDVIYDFDGIDADSFTIAELFSSDKDEHVRLHALQTRFGIRSRTDTAIGQIRTQIEGDYWPSAVFDLRHAYGEWDITPNWTFLVGQTWRTAVLLPIGVSVVDFAGSAGVNGFPRAAQVRMTYHSGPVSWAVAAEAPSHRSGAEWPDLSTYIQYDVPGGHTIIASGTLVDTSHRVFQGSESKDVGWAVQAGANINLMDVASLTVAGLYGEEGAHCTYLAQDPFCGGETFRVPSRTVFGGFDPVHPGLGGSEFFFDSDRGWGVLAGLSFGLTDTTTFNVQYGISQYDNGYPGGLIDDMTVQTVHANVLWRPVQQMQLGWEVMWGQYDFDLDSGANVTNVDASLEKDDAIRAQFGAWFFF